MQARLGAYSQGLAALELTGFTGLTADGRFTFYMHVVKSALARAAARMTGTLRWYRTLR